MVVDTSALAAILLQESDGPRFAKVLSTAGNRRLSAGSYTEFQIVAFRRMRHGGHELARDMIDEFRIDIMPVTSAQADLAAEAYARYGKGRHPAALNFGDCFAYALARSLDAPLLYKGTDFARTDLEAVDLSKL